MKRFSALILALSATASMTVTAEAQDFTAVAKDALTTGWYQMRLVKSVKNTSVSTDAPQYILSAEDEFLGTNTSKYYPLKLTETAPTSSTESPASYLVYLNGSGTSFQFQSVNGHYLNADAQTSRTAVQNDVNESKTTSSTFQIAWAWDYYETGNTTYGTYVGKYGSSNDATDYDKATFQFSKVDVESTYDVYTVKIEGAQKSDAHNDPYLTCTNSNNKGLKKVYNGGHYFFTKGTPVSASDFSATDQYCYTKNSITVDESTKTISITYTYNAEILGTLQKDAEAAIAKTGVGYPTSTASARTALASAINTAKTATTETAKAEAYPTLSAALNSFKSSTSEIQMPEDGKAYTFTIVTQKGKKGYLNYEDKTSGYTLVQTEDADNQKYPTSAILVCHKLSDDSYVFMNNAGKYLIIPMPSSDALPQGKGYSDTYTQTISGYVREVAKLQVAKIVKDTHVTTDNADLFGYVYVKGYRRESDEESGKKGVIISKDDDWTFNNSNSPYHDGSYSSAILMEEASYANNVKFSSTSGTLEGADYVATFSAPFPTIVPENVTAYYGKRNAESTKVVLTALTEGEAIPANEGVILTSSTNENVLMAPAATETVATISNNALGHSAGADKALKAGEGYILGRKDDKVAFFRTAAGTLPINHAYLLPLSNDNSVASVSISFGEVVEGIHDAVSTTQNPSPLYDLTGRRVMHPVKGRIYIQGGKKFLAK